MKKKVLIFDSQITKDFMSIKKLLETENEVKLVRSVEAFENMKNIHEGGLEYFDLIILEPYFNPHPLYGYEETSKGLHSGWFSYQQFMSNISTKIIIWSDNVYEYKYPTEDYPDREWGKNVVEFAEKDFEADQLVILVEKHLIFKS